MSIEIKKKQVMIKKIEAAIADNELKIEERLIDIERMRNNIKDQTQAIEEIEAEIAGMQGE